MLLDQKVVVKWSYPSKEHYLNKGYSFTKLKDEFEIDVNDLSKGSNVLVKYVCDYCLGKNQTEEKSKWKPYKSYLLQKKKVNKDCCNNKECVNQKNSGLFTNRKRYTKFHLTDFPNLLKEWSEKNELPPEQFVFSSPKIVWWKCMNGHEWQTSVRNRTTLNSKCPHCNYVDIEKCLHTTHFDLVKEWHPTKNTLTPYEVTGGSDRKVWWLCGKCSHEWETKISNRSINKRGCPVCKEPKGEKRIRNYLKMNSLYFQSQKEFTGLIGLNNGNLSYDFYLPKQNILIEYQGEFHDGSARKQTKVEYETQRVHDERKREYAKEHNINLLEIWYWDFDNIEEILNKELAA